MAAAACKHRDSRPRGVYETHLDDLKELAGSDPAGIQSAPLAPKTTAC